MGRPCRKCDRLSARVRMAERRSINPLNSILNLKHGKQPLRCDISPQIQGNVRFPARTRPLTVHAKEGLFCFFREVIFMVPCLLRHQINVSLYSSLFLLCHIVLVLFSLPPPTKPTRPRHTKSGSFLH